MSWHVILPFLRPLEALFNDPEVTDILVNGTDGVFAEKDGVLYREPNLRIDERSLQVAVRNIARVLGDDVGEEKPILDARLPDGWRLAAVLPPCSVKGTVLAIRKFSSDRRNIEELVRLGALTQELADQLRSAVADRQNILISGRAGSGKTTLLSALAAFVPDNERLVVIEDTAEIQIEAPNLVRLEARREQPSVPAVTMRELLKATLRLRPDRILVGEIRGGEAFDLLQVLNTGHTGTLCTLHANSAPLALTRLTTCALQSGVEIPYKALRNNIAETVHLLIHLDRCQGRRRVTQVMALRGYDVALDRYELEPIYGGA